MTALLISYWPAWFFLGAVVLFFVVLRLEQAGRERTARARASLAARRQTRVPPGYGPRAWSGSTASIGWEDDAVRWDARDAGIQAGGGFKNIGTPESDFEEMSAQRRRRARLAEATAAANARPHGGVDNVLPFERPGRSA